jgi:RNA 3'-terminal phosphate cyclase (GTP)
MIEIDGSYLEGGGQIVRTAAALCAATGRACRIFNIRRNRPRPGLALQHLLGLQALTSLSGGRLEGGTQGSMDIRFFPGQIRGGEFSVSILTAGSITLVLQLLLIPALFGEKPVTVVFEGGATDTFFAPTIDHFRFVFLEILRKMGPRVVVEIERRGFYPKGGARVRVTIPPGPILAPLALIERGNLQRVSIVSEAGVQLKARRVAERQAEAALSLLQQRKPDGAGEIHREIAYYDSLNPGSQINIRAEFEHAVLGADQLGRVGKRAEDVGRDAAWQIVEEIEGSGKACLDMFAADQILPYLALSSQESRASVSAITDHAKTNMWVIEQLMAGKFQVSGNVITWRPA